MKVYLSGPMRGIEDFNREEFAKATRWLQARGHKVFNPREMDTPDTEERYKRDPLGVARECFLRETHYICTEAEAVVCLSGWQESRGARAERALAEAIGLKVWYLLKLREGYDLY